MLDSQSKEIAIYSVRVTPFLQILEFLYCGTVVINNENAVPFRVFVFPMQIQ